MPHSIRLLEQKINMRKIFILSAAVAAVAIIGIGLYRFKPAEPDEKIYVAVEGEGRIVALNPASRKLISRIDLSTPPTKGAA